MPRRPSARKKKSLRGKADTSRNSRPGRLRIVAGNWRSRVLDIVDEPGLRPTSERVRETLFNWLGPGIAGCRCLDLFAGTGALGFEALSRGAGDTIFVERSRRVAEMLRINIDRLEASGATLIETDATGFVNAYCAAPFDIVFLDPPFADDSIAELCRLLADRRIVVSGGLVYFEQERRLAMPKLPEGWELEKQNTAGNVRYGLIRSALRPPQ